MQARRTKTVHYDSILRSQKSEVVTAKTWSGIVHSVTFVAPFEVQYGNGHRPYLAPFVSTGVTMLDPSQTTKRRTRRSKN